MNPRFSPPLAARMRDIAAVVLSLATCLPAQSWAAQQLADGRWPELPLPEDAVAAGLDPGRHAGDLRATATAVLADLADGSTLRLGPRKDALKLAVRWMCDQIDEDAGRFRAGSLDDHALAAYTLGVAYAFSHYRTLRPYAAKVTADVWRRMEDPAADKRVSPTTRALALLALEAIGELEAATRERSLAWFDVRSRTDERTSLRLAAAELMCRVVAKPDAAGRDTVRLVDRFFALQPNARKELPLDDLTLFLVTHALARLGDPAWSAWCQKLTPVAETSVDWSATPIGETGLRLVTLSLYYRPGSALPGVPPPPAIAPPPEPGDKK